MILKRGFLLLAFIIGALTTVLVAEYFNLNVQIMHNVGIIKSNIEVFSDPQCFTYIEHIDWGNIFLGSNKSVVIYIKNNLNSTTKSMSLSTDHYAPIEFKNYALVTWNCTQLVWIEPEMSKAVKVTLKIGDIIPQSIRSFAFDMIITAVW